VSLRETGRQRREEEGGEWVARGTYSTPQVQSRCPTTREPSGMADMPARRPALCRAARRILSRTAGRAAIPTAGCGCRAAVGLARVLRLGLIGFRMVTRVLTGK